MLGLALGLYLSDACLNIADNCNALGLIIPPAGRSISALFDLLILCTINGHLLLLSSDEELVDLTIPLWHWHSFHLRKS